MQFKHPEILYFLFLLAIPILVHLFQLRRFQKQYFTNVRFLKELSMQTRKSSTIKKWLLLAVRLLLLACLIVAFAQPYLKATGDNNKGNEMVILLDNSFSMQAKGSRGELLKRAVQDLLENTPESQKFSLITNNGAFWDTDIKSIQKELQNLPYSDVPFRPDFLMNKAQAKNPNTGKDVVIITDAVNLDSKDVSKFGNGPVYAITPEAENVRNIAIDSVYINQTMDNFYEVKVDMAAYGEFDDDVQVALYNGKNLVAKSLIKFDADKKSSTFTIPKKDFHGYVEVTDGSLDYDNTYYFSISKPQKSNVIAIGDADKNKFLGPRRTFTEDEFNYIDTPLSTLDYNSLQKQDLIILNELTEIPQALITTLKDFYAKGGNICIIPAQGASLQSLNALLGALGPVSYKPITDSEKQITKIANNHPLYSQVFERKVDNFQYPSVKSSYSLSGNVLPVLSYADQSAFLASFTNRLGNVYLFAAPLNLKNTNFQNSPLALLSVYNMAQNNGKMGISAITIGKNENIILDATLSKDEVLTVKNDKADFIPMQQLLNNKVKVSFGDYPETSGNYSIFKGDENLKDMSFNHARTESNLKLQNKAVLDDFTSADSVATVYNDITSERTANELWKWFIIGTLIFLVFELIIQKFVK
ncbi:MAG: BatA and WFA domain-containing protein [Bacteroidota bacterium]